MTSEPAKPCILTINGGSSSIKFALFECGPEPARLVEGGATGLAEIRAALTPYLAGRTLVGIAHRLVHGGPHFRDARVLTTDVMRSLELLVPLAPNHLPMELALVRSCTAAFPGIPEVACFDTAFFRDLPPVARTLPVPPGHDLVTIERYGFHGLSYDYLMSQLPGVVGSTLASGRVVLAHLGSGASLAAVRDGRCLDTSMGLTPLGGIVMSTRPGDLDPGVITYLMRTRGWSHEEVDDALAHRSGLAAVSGQTGDMKTLLALEASDERARLAVDLFCYQVRKWIGAFAAVLEGLDVLVFSGGIGEHASTVRARICDPLGHLGVVIDGTKNVAHASTISTDEARVRVCVIPTDEALVIARQARSVIA